MKLSKQPADVDLKKHWNKVYSQRTVEKLGWYEEFPEPSLRLINKCNLPQSARILHVGAGASRLIQVLLDKNYQNQIAVDISEVALTSLKELVGKEKSLQIHYIIDDLTNPIKLKKIAQVDLWHDRAVLHFFQAEQDQQTYFDLIRKLVKPGGYVIIAAFNLQGADTCSGLPVFRYSREMLAQRLGDEFLLIEFFNYTHTMPSGDHREYVYTLFRRKQTK